MWVLIYFAMLLVWKYLTITITPCSRLLFPKKNSIPGTTTHCIQIELSGAAVGSGKGEWNRWEGHNEERPRNYLASWTHILIALKDIHQRTVDYLCDNIKGLGINEWMLKPAIRHTIINTSIRFLFSLSLRTRQAFQTNNQIPCEVIYSTLDVIAFLTDRDLTDA